MAWNLLFNRACARPGSHLHGPWGSQPGGCLTAGDFVSGTNAPSGLKTEASGPISATLVIRGFNDPIRGPGYRSRAMIPGVYRGVRDTLMAWNFYNGFMTRDDGGFTARVGSIRRHELVVSHQGGSSTVEVWYHLLAFNGEALDTEKFIPD